VVRPSAVSEDRLQHETPVSFVQRIAEKKARACEARPEDTVLGADTVVVVNSQIFGKPADEADARRMLRSLSGLDHHVYTGICLLTKERTIVGVSDTRVWFNQLMDEEIDRYVRSGEPFDKAGAYGIQGRASKFVTAIEGCYHNVVGLPLSMVYNYLKLIGNIS
jgi:septum formation protein